MSERQNTAVFFVDPGYDFADRLEIGKEIVTYLQDRTRDGQGVGGRSLGTYSANYQRTADFEAAGKDSQVNLTLTGDMLSSIQVIDVSIPGRIEVGFEEGFENDKSVWVEEKGYNFLDMTQAELDDILSGFATPTEAQNVAEGLAEGIAASVLRGLFGN
jgi:hypothetical protein